MLWRADAPGNRELPGRAGAELASLGRPAAGRWRSAKRCWSRWTGCWVGWWTGRSRTSAPRGWMPGRPCRSWPAPARRSRPRGCWSPARPGRRACQTGRAGPESRPSLRPAGQRAGRSCRRSCGSRRWRRNLHGLRSTEGPLASPGATPGHELQLERPGATRSRQRSLAAAPPWPWPGMQRVAAVKPGAVISRVQPG